CIRKFMEESLDGNLMNFGGNWAVMRYPEDLLGYLVSKLEAGDPIDQPHVDATISLVRARQNDAMPEIAVPGVNALRSVIRREGRVEFAFEGLRYFDVLRWGIAAQELNRQFTGMKLTNNPAGYKDFPVDDEGYLIYQRRNFKAGVNELWPIPLSELQ